MQLSVPIVFGQSPLGNCDDSCHEEIPQPHEPQRGGSRCPGQTRGSQREAAQPQAPEHRVGNPVHCEIGGYCVIGQKGTPKGGEAPEPAVVIDVDHFVTSVLYKFNV